MLTDFTTKNWVMLYSFAGGGDKIHNGPINLDFRIGMLSDARNDLIIF